MMAEKYKDNDSVSVKIVRGLWGRKECSGGEGGWNRGALPRSERQGL